MKTILGPLMGIRGWYIHRGPEFSLYSLITRQSWNIPEVEARCVRYRHDDISPSDNCSCGIYTYKIDENARNILCELLAIKTIDTIGIVYQWGKVIEHEKGYRSQYAKIKKLYIPLQRLRERKVSINEVLRALKFINVDDIFFIGEEEIVNFIKKTDIKNIPNIKPKFIKDDDEYSYAWYILNIIYDDIYNTKMGVK